MPAVMIDDTLTDDSSADDGLDEPPAAQALTSEVSESPRNMQLRDLAVLVHVNFHAVRNVTVAIIQPHATRDELATALAMTAGWNWSRPFKTGVLQT